MRQNIALTARRAPASLGPLARQSHVCRTTTSRVTPASAVLPSLGDHARAFASSSSPYFVRPSLQRLQSGQWNTDQTASTSASSQNPLPPTLASTQRPATRRRSPTAPQSNPSSSPSALEGEESRHSTVRTAKTDEPALDESGPATSASPDSNAKDAVRTDTSLPTSKSANDTAVASESSKKTIAQRIKGLWENVKYLFRFYYNGVKQIWQNRAVIADMRKQISERNGEMRWTEKAAIELHEADLRKLPLFLAILIILEEVLPLVVIYAPSLLPSTCVLPSQSLKMRSEEERRRALAVQNLAKDEHVRAAVERIVNQSCHTDGESVPAEEDAASALPQKQLSDLSPSVVRDLAAVFGLRTWGPLSLVHSRIQQHQRFLQSDDALLERAWQARSQGDAAEWTQICTTSWLWRASGKRGLRSSAADEGDMERNVEAYLHLIRPAGSEQDAAVTSASTALHRLLIPLALYDGTQKQLHRLQSAATQEQSKGIRVRTQEVVQNVVQEAKRKEAVKEA